MSIDSGRERKSTTIDVAKAAGVSQAAVSMIMNNKENVSFSDETVKRVMEAAKELNYVPRARKKASSAVERGGKNVVALLFPNVENPYYVMLGQGIQYAAKQTNYALVTCITNRDPELERQFLELLNGWNARGVIYTYAPIDRPIAEEAAKKLPVVMIGDVDSDSDSDAVDFNSVRAGALAAEHLISLGHEKIAVVCHHLVDRQIAPLRRVEGVKQKMEEYGIADKLIIDYGDRPNPAVEVGQKSSEYSVGYRAAVNIIANYDVTAFIGTNDMVAFGIMDAIHDAKKRVPQDYSVCGFDNTLFSAMRGISLTTIERFAFYNGKDAFEIMRNKITAFDQGEETAPESVYHVEYTPKLIARGSTAINRNKKPTI